MIDIVAFKANSEDTVLSEFENVTPHEAIGIVPSTLMKTPSSEFALGYSAVLKSRAIACEFNFTASSMTITKYQGTLASNVGLHIVSFKKNMGIDVSSFSNNMQNTVYLTFTYVPNDAKRMEYPLDDVKIISQPSGDTAPINSVPICRVSVSSGSITGIVSMVNPLLSPAIKGDLTDFMTDTEIANIYLTQASASNNYLSLTDAVNTYLSKSDASSTYLTQVDAHNTYLTQVDANSTFLKEADANSNFLKKADANTIYLKKADANTNYLKKTDVVNNVSSTSITKPLSANMGKALKTMIDAKLEKRSGWVRDLKSFSNPASSNGITWVGANGATEFIGLPHQELVDIFYVSTNSGITLEFDSMRRAPQKQSVNSLKARISIKGTFIGSRRNSWYDLSVYVSIFGFTVNTEVSGESTDKWKFRVRIPLQSILRARMGNNNLLLDDPEHSLGWVAGVGGMHLNQYRRASGSSVLVPTLTCVHQLNGADNLDIVGDSNIHVAHTEIRQVRGLTASARINGIGRL